MGILLSNQHKKHSWKVKNFVALQFLNLEDLLEFNQKVIQIYLNLNPSYLSSEILKYGSRGHKELDMTEQLNWTELK